jgi:hypothetical protein
MTPETTPRASCDWTAFIAKLDQFRGALTPEEQHLFDTLLLTAAQTPDGEVQGYGFGGSPARQLALAAVVALGIVGGTLSPALGGSALAAPQEQPALNGNMGTGTAARTPASGTTATATGGTPSGAANRQATTSQAPAQQARTQPASTHTGSVARTGTGHTGAAMPTGGNTPYTLRDPLQEALRGIQPLGAPPAPRQPSLEEQFQRAQDNLIQEMVRQREAEIARQIQDMQDDIVRQIEDEVRRDREHAARMAALQQQLERQRQATAQQADTAAQQREAAIARARQALADARALPVDTRVLGSLEWSLERRSNAIRDAEQALRALTTPSNAQGAIEKFLEEPPDASARTGPSSGPSPRIQGPGPIDWVQ